MKVEELLSRVPEEIIEIVRDYDIMVEDIRPILPWLGIRGSYDMGTIEVDSHSGLKFFLHELGHAVDDLLGTLDDSKIRTGEMTAHLFANMMLLNTDDPEEIFAESVFDYLDTLTETKHHDEKKPIRL